MQAGPAFWFTSAQKTYFADESNIVNVNNCS